MNSNRPCQSAVVRREKDIKIMERYNELVCWRLVPLGACGAGILMTWPLFYFLRYQERSSFKPNTDICTHI